MRFIAASAPAVLYLMMAIQTSAFAQRQQAAPSTGAPSSPEQSDEEQPTPAPLTVGSMAIASDRALSIEAMTVDVAIEQVTYTYRLRNNGASKLALAATVSQPDIEVNSDGSTIYLLPSDKAENVIELKVKSNGEPVPTTPEIQAVALGKDRRAELTSAQIPLIPFGEATDKAFAAAKPETIASLEKLGVLAPRDPSQPDAPVIGDWSLHVVRGWTQYLNPGSPTEVTVSFAPIKAVYTIDLSSVASFDALADAACLTPQLMKSVRALLVAKGSTVDVADILVANDGPARWLQNPPARIVIRKPTPEALVSFCGIDPKAQTKATVEGTMPNSSEAAALRVLIFARAGAQ